MGRKNAKLVPWLIERLDSAKFAHLGLEWKDRKEGLYWFPYPRQKSKSWNEEQSEIFLDYMRMQGNYDHGDKDWVKWKHVTSMALSKMTRNMNKSEKNSSTGITRKLYQIYQLANNNYLDVLSVEDFPSSEYSLSSEYSPSDEYSPSSENCLSDEYIEFNFDPSTLFGESIEQVGDYKIDSIW